MVQRVPARPTPKPSAWDELSEEERAIFSDLLPTPTPTPTPVPTPEVFEDPRRPFMKPIPSERPKPKFRDKLRRPTL